MLQSILLSIAMLIAQPATAPSATPSSAPSTAPSTAPTSAPSTNPSPPPKISDEEALTAINSFLADPAPNEDLTKILRFAQQSDDINIVVDNAIAPWLNKKPPYPTEMAFLVAFIAGNARAQLLDHKKEDSPYPGLQAVIHTYQKMRAADHTDRIPEIEKLADMEDKDELKAHVEEIVKDRKK